MEIAVNHQGVLHYEPLIHNGFFDKYNKGEYIVEPQCSTVQVYNFRNISSFDEFYHEIKAIPYYTMVCVTWTNCRFYKLKWTKFWEYKVVRVCATGGGGTLWVIKKRTWTK